MRKKSAGLLLGVLACSMLLSACGKNEATEAVNESEAVEKEGNGETEKKETEEGEEENAQEGEGSTEEEQEEILKVGVLFPEEEGKWAEDRLAIKEKLEKAGYEPQIFSADNDASVQISQIQELVDAEAAALIIAPVDVYALPEILVKAEEKEIPVFSYDGLIMDTDNIKYYTTFDTRDAGKKVGENIVKLKDLKKAREEKLSYTIEFLMGSPDEISELFFYNGILEVLQEYFDDGTLVCKSGRMTFDDTGIMSWSENAAKSTMNSIFSEFYAAEGTPDIICTAADKFTYGILELLEEKEILPSDENWPLITGVGSEAQAIKNVAEGKLAFTLFMDRNDLAETCVKMVSDYLAGEKPEVKNYSQYDNGKKIIGTQTCEAKLIDKDNYQLLIDNGTYTAEEIEPENPMPTPTPEVTPTPTV